jgi:hypothetical protein
MRLQFFQTSGDPLATPIERLLEIHVAQTWVGGALTYEA